MEWTLLASAPSLEAAQQAATRFYCGQAMHLEPDGEAQWAILRKSDGKRLEGVRVIRAKRGRFRFEMSA